MSSNETPETYHVRLILDNDEGSYHHVQALTLDAVAPYDMESHRASAQTDLQEALREYVSILAGLESDADNLSTMARELLGVAMSGVDWYDLAGDYLDAWADAHTPHEVPEPIAIDTGADLVATVTVDDLSVAVTLQRTDDGPLLRLIAAENTRLDGESPGDYYVLPDPEPEPEMDILAARDAARDALRYVLDQDEEHIDADVLACWRRAFDVLSD